MEDDLTWLARNVHDWTGMRIEKLFKSEKSPVGYGFVAYPECIGAPFFTRDQWLARRAELQNKPRFADHPDAKCFFQHESGRWFKNVESSDMGVDGIGWRNNQLSHRIDCGWVDIGLGEVLGDWRDTLERRPVDLSGPAVTARLTEATENVLAAVPALMDEKFSIDRNDWFERGELPPVGIECEVLWDDREWHKTKIIAHLYIDKFNMCPVFTTGWDDTSFVECMPHYQSFLPLRTEREKAIEEMKQHCPHHGSWDTVGRIYAEALYDAGYRKHNLPAK